MNISHTTEREILIPDRPIICLLLECSQLAACSVKKTLVKVHVVFEQGCIIYLRVTDEKSEVPVMAGTLIQWNEIT